MDNQGAENPRMHISCTQGTYSLEAKTKHPKKQGFKQGRGTPKRFFSAFKRTVTTKAFLMNHKTREGGSREKHKLCLHLSVTFGSVSTAKTLHYLPFTCCVQ